MHCAHEPRQQWDKKKKIMSKQGPRDRWFGCGSVAGERRRGELAGPAPPIADRKRMLPETGPGYNETMRRVSTGRRGSLGGDALLGAAHPG